MSNARLISIQVGKARETAHGRSAYVKAPVAGPVSVEGVNLAGDEQVHLGPHGGPDRVVLGYAASHYPVWQADLEGQALPFGAFGENFTIAGLTEENVCVGDRHRFGDLVLEVTQPRVPCLKIEKHNGIPGLYDRVRKSGRIGWLYRVIAAGEVQADTPVVVEAGPCPTWTIARAFDVVMRHRAKDASVAEQAAELARCPALATAMREKLPS
jgi:MOSC domain-containing protein YiiM